MRPLYYAQLCAIARREAGSLLAEDVVQEALLVAVQAGRHDLGLADNRRWIGGVVRNKARMAARGARRGRLRDGAWQSARSLPAIAEAGSQPDPLEGLSPGLRALAALVLSGHNRREIAYLLGLPDTALRQRIAGLKRAMTQRGLAAPAELSGLNLDLAYGRIRDALLPVLHRHGGRFASHDPDGHLFVMGRSQNRSPRQSTRQTKMEGSS